MPGEVGSLVSVIMPVYNASPFLAESIKSILDQTHDLLELLIMDDASTDDSKAIVDSFTDPRITFFQSAVNQGYLKTCNALFAKVNGDYVTFQDADDVSDRQRLEKQLEAFGDHPDLGICGTSIYRVGPNGNILREEKKESEDKTIRSVIMEHPQFCGATIMIKREVLEDIGGYRSYFDRIGSEDYDWSCRIVEKYQACNLPEPLYSYRQVSGSISKGINLKIWVASEMVKFFAEQRRNLGIDSIQARDHEIIKENEEKLLAPYVANPALIYLKYASWYNYNEMYSDAIEASYMAIRKKPFAIENWRTLLYCIKVMLLSKK